MSFYKDKLLYYNLDKNNYKFKKYLSKTNQYGGFYNKQIPTESIDKFDKLCLAAFHGEINDKEFILDDKTYLLIPFADGCVNYYKNAFDFTGIKINKPELIICNEEVSHFTNISSLITLINNNIKVNKLVDIDGTQYQLLHPGDTTCNITLSMEYNISGKIMGTFNPFYNYHGDFVKAKNAYLNIDIIKKAILIMHGTGTKSIICNLYSLMALLRLDNKSDARILRTMANIINVFFKYILCSVKEKDFDIGNLNKYVFSGIGNFFTYIFSPSPNIFSDNDAEVEQIPTAYIEDILEDNFDALFFQIGILEINTGSKAKKDKNKDKNKDEDEEEEVFDSGSILDGEEVFDSGSILDGEEEVFDSGSILDGEEEVFDSGSILDREEEVFDSGSILDEKQPLIIDKIITMQQSYKITDRKLYLEYKTLIVHQIISLLFLTMVTFYDIDKIYNLKSHKTLYDLLNHISLNTPADKKNLIINISCRTEPNSNYSNISKCISYSCITPKIISLIEEFNTKNNLLLSEVSDNKYIISGILSLSVFSENIFTAEMNYKKLIEETIRYIDLLDIHFRGTIIIPPHVRKNFNEGIKQIYGDYVEDRYVNIIIESAKNYSNYKKIGSDQTDSLSLIVNFIKIVIKHVLFNLIHSTMKKEIILSDYDYLNNLIETKYPILKTNDIVIFISEIKKTNSILARELLVLYFNVFIKANNKMINRFSK
jgi:hypothetical protein